jgi:hypothetical protein
LLQTSLTQGSQDGLRETPAVQTLCAQVGDPHWELLHTEPTSLTHPAPQVLEQQVALTAQIMVTQGSQPEASLAPVAQSWWAHAAPPLEVDDEEAEVVELALVEELVDVLVVEELVDVLVLVDPALVVEALLLALDEALVVSPAPPADPPPFPPRDPIWPESRVVPWAQAATRHAPRTSETRTREAKAMGDPRC